ncbi:MAG TPA: GerMN domain-containing protein [Micromonosporaceae bacterium]|nr:GerMN domain-containing protein [Micromonosporaceae bacterium]
MTGFPPEGGADRDDETVRLSRGLGGHAVDLGALLHEALEDRAANVTLAPDALGDIRRRIAAKRARWWTFPALRSRGATMISLSTAVAASVAAVTIGFASCTPQNPNPNPNPNPAGPSASSGPISTGSPTTGATSPTGTPTSPPPGGTVTANVPIYYIGANDLLYREYHRIPAGNGTPAAQVKAGITQMLDGRTAYDHDYVSQWPASASVRSVSISGGVATVDLHGATVNGDDPAGNKAAIQQLIWTATAFQGATGVRLLFDGQARATLWASRQPVAGVLHRAAAVDALAPVWVIDPQQNAVTGTSVTVNLAGIVFEGTIQMRVRSAAGKVVVQKTVQLSVGAPVQGVATVHITLTPGTYTVEAYEVSLKDGSIVALDGHTFTVH